MSENKAKLIALISAIEEENIIDYFYTFSGLKVYQSAAKLPESIRADLRRLWDEHFGIQLDEEEEEPEPWEISPGVKEAMCQRCEIIGAVCDIKSIAILNYINIIVEDVHKEAREMGATYEKENH